MLELDDKLKEAYIEGAKALKGSDRRLFMARIVKSFGRGGQSFAHKVLGWDPKTVRKGLHELRSGIVVIDDYSTKGRKRAEFHLPNLLIDLKDIADSQSQTDPTFKSTRLYTRITAKEARKQLILQKGYTDEELPKEDAIRRKLNDLGFRVKAVKKSQPKKKSQKQTKSSKN
jgi:hypothetical protein